MVCLNFILVIKKKGRYFLCYYGQQCYSIYYIYINSIVNNPVCF